MIQDFFYALDRSCVELFHTIPSDPFLFLVFMFFRCSSLHVIKMGEGKEDEADVFLSSSFFCSLSKFRAGDLHACIAPT